MHFKEEAVLKSKIYEIEMTLDQSPTLRPEQNESMHHMGGAAGESVYLYYEALSRFVRQNPNRKAWRVLSLGFGMGYNELLTIVYFLEHKMDISNLDLVSYEKDLFLYELFNSWLIDDDPQSLFDHVLAGINRALPEVTVSMNKVKTAMKELLQNKRWHQLGPIEQISDFEGTFDVVYYDAFSAKTSGHLWSEEILTQFFAQKLNSSFVFSTYACTAVLKRVAAQSESHFDRREAYTGKRNCSLISRSL